MKRSGVVSLLFSVLLACSFVSLYTGCSGDLAGKLKGMGDYTGTDSDGDGLSDSAEYEYGTNPGLADTDGDGMSDGKEVNDMGFNPEVDPYSFNPLIADIPSIEVKITSQPLVAINYNSSSSSTKSVTNSTATQSSYKYARTDSSSESESYEHAVGLTIGGEYKFGLNGGWTASGSVHYDFTHKSETVNSWTNEQARENTLSYSEAITKEQTEGISSDGARIAVSLDLVNHSRQYVRLSNIILSSYQVDTVDPSIHYPIGNLEIDTMQSSGATIDLAPGAASEGLNCYNGGLYVDDAKSLLKNSNGLIVKVANVTSEIQVENEVGTKQWFSPDLTTAYSRTAKVVLEYGLGTTKSPSRREYFVATNLDDSLSGITAARVMDMLHLDYQTGLVGLYEGLTGVAGESDDESINGYWIVFHSYRNEGEEKLTFYDIRKAGYDFDDIVINTGDVLHLLYIEDRDGDGISGRDEMYSKTYDAYLDTDGDNIPDSQDPYPTIKDAAPVEDVTLADVATFSQNGGFSTDTGVALQWTTPPAPAFNKSSNGSAALDSYTYTNTMPTTDTRVKGYLVVYYPEASYTPVPVDYANYQRGYRFLRSDGTVIGQVVGKDTVQDTDFLQTITEVYDKTSGADKTLSNGTSYRFGIFTYDDYCRYSKGKQALATTDGKWVAKVTFKAYYIDGRDIPGDGNNGAVEIWWHFYTSQPENATTGRYTFGYLGINYAMIMDDGYRFTYPWPRTDIPGDGTGTDPGLVPNTLGAVTVSVPRETSQYVDLNLFIGDQGGTVIAQTVFRVNYINNSGNEYFTCYYNNPNYNNDMGAMTIDYTQNTLDPVTWNIPLDTTDAKQTITGLYKADFVLPGTARIDVAYEITTCLGKP